MNDKWFVIPGIIGMILQTLAIEQAAIFLVRDREWGMMEQILATPVRQLELILSKMIPLSILCLLAFGISVGLGIFWFGVPFHGNLFLYFWLALLFLASCLGLGLVISTRATTQFEAEASSDDLHAVWFAIDRTLLSTNRHAADSAIDWRYRSVDLFHSHLARHLHERCRIKFCVGRCLDSRHLYSDRCFYFIQEI